MANKVTVAEVTVVSGLERHQQECLITNDVYDNRRLNRLQCCSRWLRPKRRVCWAGRLWWSTKFWRWWRLRRLPPARLAQPSSPSGQAKVIYTGYAQGGYQGGGFPQGGFPQGGYQQGGYQY